MLGGWQTWNAFVGGFWDNNGIGNPGVGSPGVLPLSAFLAAYPDATIASSGYAGLGGIAMQVGFGSSADTFNGNVDAFTIGIGGVDTTYNFDRSRRPSRLRSCYWAWARGAWWAASRRRAVRARVESR